MFKAWEYFFLVAAFLSFVLSNAFWFNVIHTATPHETGIYVGIWVPSIISTMAYFKVFVLQAVQPDE